MRFMMLMIPGGYQKASADTRPDKDAVERMSQYNQDLDKAGLLRSMNGLHPLSDGARVTYAGGTPNVVDGPYIETKEVLGGYWIVEAKSKQEVLEWAKKIPAGPTDTVEIRRIFETSDFPKDVQDVLKGDAEFEKKYKQ